jgi:hypothetical protein
MTARAEALAAKTGNLRHLAEQIYGSWLAAEVSGNYPSAMALADQMLDVARHVGGAVTRSLGINVQLVTRFGIGDLPTALHRIWYHHRMYLCYRDVKSAGATEVAGLSRLV